MEEPIHSMNMTFSSDAYVLWKDAKYENNFISDCIVVYFPHWLRYKKPLDMQMSEAMDRVARFEARDTLAARIEYFVKYEREITEALFVCFSHCQVSQSARRTLRTQRMGGYVRPFLMMILLRW
jgi:hypothetical protein